MPIYDCEDYSFGNIKYVFPFMNEELQRSGRSSLSSLSYFTLNIYLGAELIRFHHPEQRFHVCRVRDYGCLAVVFHQIAPAAVVKQASEELSKIRHTCITIVWAAQIIDAAVMLDGINAADDIVKSIELSTGKPCLISVAPALLPERFEIAKRTSSSLRVVQRVLCSDRKPFLPVGDERIASHLLAWEGVDKLEYSPDNVTPQNIVQRASVWQRKAIRARAMGDTELVVIASQTWVEVFIIQIARAINEAAGEPIPDVRAEVMKGLHRFINTWLGSKHLKGRWDQTDASTQFGRWYTSCFGLRNEVVHGGKHPTHDEASAAYESAHGFVWFVTEEIAKLKPSSLENIARHFRAMVAWRTKTSLRNSVQ